MTARRRRILFALVMLGLAGVAAAVLGRHLVAEHHYRAARLALESDDFDEAVRHLNRCLETWPDSSAAHLLAARVARRSGDRDRAEDQLRQAKRCGADPDALTLEWVLLSAQAGEMTPAQESYLKDCAARGGPDRVEILEALSRGYARVYRLNDALAALTDWLELRPNDRAALLKRSWVYERLHRLEDAEVDCHRVTEHHPNDGEALLRRGQLLLALERQADALPLFEKLRESRPDSPAVAVGLARAYRGLGRTEEAEKVLDAACAAHPDEGPVLLERGRLAVQTGDRAAALPWLRRAAGREPWDYAVNYALFQCLEALGEKVEAEKVGRRVEEIKADLARMGELTDALQKAPYSPALRCEIGRLFLRHGEKREGVLWLQSALAIEPDYPPARQALVEHQDRPGGE
ncbi:MAG TPA: tetratricopeptide repeat protein [Gemmataceae bacterium]|nr:tetratricopeptide repeat protein [Gemmataceae bacterium]